MDDSIRVRVRLEATLVALLHQLAANQNISINNLIKRILQRWVVKQNRRR